MHLRRKGWNWYWKLNLMDVWWQVQGFFHSAALLDSSFWGPESIIDIASQPLWCLYLRKSTQHVQRAWWGDLIYQRLKKKTTQKLYQKSDIFLAYSIMKKKKRTLLHILKLPLKVRYSHNNGTNVFHPKIIGWFWLYTYQWYYSVSCECSNFLLYFGVSGPP